MPIPVLICDDSSLARKQIARALPPNWDVEITFAGNGEEGVAALREGKGDVLFLDLTMPVMDGFEVLEVIRREDLPTLPIVVSGDIQADSEARVRRNGAVAFLKKPVDKEQLLAVLDEYGLLQLTTEDERELVEQEVGFTDWCQEVANISKGRAADLLAKVIHEPVTLSIPRVSLIEPGDLSMFLMHASGEGGGYLVAQGFTGRKIAGEMLLIFYDTSLDDIIELLSAQDPFRGTDQEALMEVSDVLCGAFLKSLADLLQLEFGQGLPVLYNMDRLGGELYSKMGRHQGRVLAICFDYAIGQRVKCDQLVLFTEQSMTALEQRAEVSIG